eukprot:m.770568 g.770568  ORF g.770568 m.770568 type:complete len:69 (+) comp23240_c0_seq29:1772-1978(+)
MTKKDHEQNLNDFEGFMQDLEEDPELRSTINIYRDPAYAQGPVLYPNVVPHFAEYSYVFVTFGGGFAF